MNSKGNALATLSKPSPEVTEVSLGDIPEDVYRNISFERANEILRQSELRRNALLDIATAADDRAVQFLVAASALAAAAMGAAAALGSTGSPIWVWLGLTVAAACYVAAAGSAAWAARPEKNYEPPGIVPDQVWNSEALSLSDRDFILLLIGAAHTAIWRSQRASQTRSKWTHRALWIAALAPIVAAVIASFPWVLKLSLWVSAKVALLA